MLIVESVNAEKKRFPLMVMKNYFFGRYSNVYGRCRSAFVWCAGSYKREREISAGFYRPEKATPEQLREYLAEVLPNFDRERVYVADIKKLVAWYNILISNGITEFKPEGEVKEEAAAE